jgi:hypothetical protein
MPRDCEPKMFFALSLPRNWTGGQISKDAMYKNSKLLLLTFFSA